MKGTYRVLASLVALGVVVQAAAIAFAMFGVAHEIDNGAVVDKNFEGNAGFAIHAIGGQMIIPLLALILFVVSFFAKVPGGVKWAGFVLLAVVVQVALAFISFGVAAVGMLHGLNALVVFSLAVVTARRVRLADPAVAPATVDAGPTLDTATA